MNAFRCLFKVSITGNFRKSGLTSHVLKSVYCDSSKALSYAVSGYNNHITSNAPITKLCFEKTPCLTFCCYFSSESTKGSKQEKWENLLGDSDKQEQIHQAPVKKENPYTIPNFLSLFRLCLTPYIGYLVLCHEYKLTLGLFVLAGITDVVDGQIARTWPSQQSALGSALDPLADKVLVAVLCLSLTYVGVLPWQLTALFVSRDLLLIAAVFYLRYRTCPPPRTLKRFFDPTLVNAKLAPTLISKVNTTLQMILIWSSVAAPAFEISDSFLLKVLWGLTATTTVWSGLSYITSKETVQILKDN